ncbi:MAG: Do family serine endopeptidase [Armatimonadetes bacterium]|nr:Do family serine endopeptidase [Armatimonadota bacterium]
MSKGVFKLTPQVAGVVSAAILGVSLVGGAALIAPKMQTGTATAATATVAPELLQLQNSFSALATQVEPSVVSITAERKVNVSSGIPDIFRNFPFGNVPAPRTRSRTQTVGGSGVIVRSDGYILTNDHVVGGMDNVEVKLDDGRKFPGKVLRDYATDLAVVKIDATNLPAATLADSSKVKPGNWAIAIGSPFGLSNTLTVGVVSALERENVIPDSQGGARYYASLIQTDAAINPGNSGGPLLDITGKVIGINVMIESPSGANAGIGFAIPSNTARFVMDQLIAKGKVVRGYLGVAPSDVEPADAKRYKVEKGAIVSSVTDDTPASKAGMQVEDVIVEFNGKPIKDALSLREMVARTEPGTKAAVVVVRNGERKTLNVTVGTFPDQNPSGDSESTTVGNRETLGVSVQSLTADMRSQLGLGANVKGVVVSDVDSSGPAAEAGLQQGDVIQKVDQKPVTTPAEFRTAVKNLKPGDTTILVVRRKDSVRAVEVNIPRE